MSPHFSRVAKEVFGYHNVKYMIEGITTWQAGINPTYTSPEWLRMAMDTGAPYILVDVRKAADARRAHIPTAVNFPLTEMAALEKALAGNRKDLTRIIFYGYSNDEATQAHRIMRANGWKETYILDDGIHGWGLQGYATVENQFVAKLEPFEWKPPAGAMYKEEFEALARNTPDDVVILDVRSPAEYMKSMVPGALTIPIDTLRERLDELPKDKTIVAYCQAANRNLMAYRMLTENGFKNVRWLHETVASLTPGTLQAGAYAQK